MRHANHAPEGKFVILGKPLIGQRLIARPGGIIDADGWQRLNPSFQWLSDGYDITGATKQVYTVRQEDAGKVISCRYTYTDARGTVETVVSTGKTVDDPVAELIENFYAYVFDRLPDRAGFQFYYDLHVKRGIPMSKIMADMEHNAAEGAT